MVREAISVIGLGYIGLPLAMCLCEQGHRVIGIDVDPVKLRDLSAGRTQVMESYEGEPLASILQRHLASGRFVPTGDWAMSAEASSHIITVGIPVHENGVPDPLPLLAAIRSLGAVLRQGDLVLVRSTLVPGMMEQDIIPLLAETSRMVPGTDFAVAYAAERVAEGRAMYEFRTLDVVVGGLTPACGERAKALLSTLTDGQVHLTDLRTAQLTKVIENVQRDVNIALAHQIKEIAEHHGVDVYELIRLANTHPRVRLLEPGLGVGGYCIPNAYAYIAASLPKTRPVPLLTLARRINEEAPIRAAAQLERQLAALGKRLRESTVAILGLGMKDGSNDVRHSPAVALAHYLRHRGARVRAFDPTVPIQFPYQTETLAACLDGADAVAVAAWQPAFDGVAWREALAHACAPLVLLDPKHRLQSRLSPCGAGVDAAPTGSCLILADPASATVQHAGHTAPGGRVAR